MNLEHPVSSIEECVYALAEAHDFELLPGKALIVAGKGHTNNLIIAVFDHEHRYMLSQTFTRDSAEVPGFRVYYDREWNPVHASDENNTPLSNLQAASDDMSVIVAAFCGSPAAQ